MFVIPKKGLKIPDPDMQDYLPETGRDVVFSAYWQRRLNDGEVSKGRPIPTPPAIMENKT